MSDEVVAPVVEAPVVEAAAPVVEVPVEGEAPKVEEVKAEKPPESPEQAEKRKGQARYDRKIKDAYRKEAEAKAENALLRRQLEELKPQPKDSGEPNIADFSDVEEYATAKAKHASDKALRTHQDTISQKQQQEARQQVVTAWQERVAKADSKYEDFDEVVGDLQPNSPFTAAIMQAENGEDVAYYLGKNIGEAQKIAGLNPLAQAMAIGRLAAKLEAEPPKVHTPSKAPAPIKPIGGGSAGPDKRLSEGTYDDFAKRRKAFIAANR